MWIQIVRLALGGIVPQLRRGARALAARAYAAYAWMLLAGFGGCAWLVAMLPLPRRATWWSVRALARALVALTGSRVDVRGTPALGSATIVVSNHQSYLDGPLLFSLLPEPAEFVVKGELERPWYLAHTAASSRRAFRRAIRRRARCCSDAGCRGESFAGRS